MSSLVALSDALASAITATLTGANPAPRGLPAIQTYQAILDPEQIDEAQLWVVPAGIDALEDTTDTVQRETARTVSVVFGERLVDRGPLAGSAAIAELDVLVTWIEQLYQAVRDIDVAGYGRPSAIDFVSPGASQLYVWDWLREHGVFCSVIAVTYESESV